MQALLPFLAPPPERLAELARRLYVKLIITGDRDDLYEHFITKNRLEKVGNNHRNLDLFFTIVYSRPEALRDFAPLQPSPIPVPSSHQIGSKLSRGLRGRGRKQGISVVVENDC